MIFEYEFPRVFCDRDDIGDIVTALSNYPKNTADILAAHDRAWDSHKGEADEAATEANRKQQQMQIEQLQAEIATLTAERDRALAECAPDLQAIAPALQAASLTAWADRAITAADPDNGVLDLVLELYGVAKETRSLGQCERVTTLFVKIGTLSGVWPTPEEAIAMQAILNDNNVGEKWLKFA